MRFRNFLVISICLLGIVFLSGCVEKMITYENILPVDDSEFGLRIKYPSDWIIDEENVISTYISISLDPPEKTSQAFDFTAFVELYQKDRITLDERTSLLINTSCEKQYPIELNDIEISELPARKLVCTWTPGVKLLTVYAIKTQVINGTEIDKLGEVVYIAKADEYSKYINEVNKMINSFEII